MSKKKTTFTCQNCGASSAKWVGRCPSCNEWNTYAEELVVKHNQKGNLQGKTPQHKPQLISEISTEREERIDTRINELNRILGGGLVPGSVVLLGGEPGIGKSTLALQVGMKLGGSRIFYISGEESNRQIRLRADRIGLAGGNCYILCETSLENILSQLHHNSPDVVIVDSIQTVHTESVESSPGSVSQVRECAAALLRYAKETSTPVFLIGHINKEGSLAGPKVLEHIVDVVLQFEGDHNHMYRILRASKNRFGATSELGIFEMRETGLKEVQNPSEILITHKGEELGGTAVAATIDGIRPFLIEIQALVSSAAYGTPQRSATGFDLRRLGMLLAVLEKQAGFRLAAKDVFLNIAGGIRVTDTAIDMAVIAAVLSSSVNIAVSPDICFAGEVGLSGEIRPVSRIEQRIGEAAKLGFGEIIISSHHKGKIHADKQKMKVTFASGVKELFRLLFRKSPS